MVSYFDWWSYRSYRRQLRGNHRNPDLHWDFHHYSSRHLQEYWRILLDLRRHHWSLHLLWQHHSPLYLKRENSVTIMSIKWIVSDESVRNITNTAPLPSLRHQFWSSAVFLFDTMLSTSHSFTISLWEKHRTPSNMHLLDGNVIVRRSTHSNVDRPYWHSSTNLSTGSLGKSNGQSYHRSLTM